MKTAVAETSIAVFHDIRRDGTLSHRQEQIMAVIKRGRDYSLQELVHLTGLPVNVVSGRCFELREDGRLVLGSIKRKCSHTGRNIAPVLLPPLPGQQVLFS